MIEVKPAPKKNPDGLKYLPWNVWRDGKHSTIQPDYDAACEAAARLRDRTGDMDRPDDVIRPMHKDKEPVEDYLEVKNAGAPDIGMRVKETLPSGKVVVGWVKEHLATQFIIETVEGKIRTITNDGDWEY